MIPIARPVLDEAEADAARDAVMSGWLSQGPQVAAFEAEFAQAVDAPYACAVSNCTTAMHLALLVAGVRPGDEVITVSHSFIATANVVRACGATPVFVDVEPATFNIDVGRVAAAFSPRTRAILCVHQLGMPCDLPPLVALARARETPLIEDAACAIGSQIRVGGEWRPIGAPHGDVACFSLHPRKVITTGEGGMLTTRRSDWDARFRLLRQHGMSVSDTARHAAREVVFEAYPVSGFNYRMTDMQAAIGRRQLQRLPGIVARRRRLAARYTAWLRDVPDVTSPAEPAWARSNWQSYCVRLAPEADQRRVMQAMLDCGVATRRGVMCAHLEDAFAGGGAPALPRSEEAQRTGLMLPLYPQMEAETQWEVVVALRAALAQERGRAPAPRLEQGARVA